MRLLIDASNIRAGGGVTHLVEVLRAANPDDYGIERIAVWSSAATLAKIPDRDWLDKHASPKLETNPITRAIWQRFKLGNIAKAFGADLLFVPGGSIVPDFRPAVTMCRNMVPFEWKEFRRFGFTLIAAKIVALRWSQIHSFKKAAGTIFLTRYAFDTVLKATGPLRGAVTTISHGIDEQFRREPRQQRQVNELTANDPLRMIYVSAVDYYKHQWVVADAVARLRAEGFAVRLDLYGPARPSALPLLTRKLEEVDPEQKFIKYWGGVDHSELRSRYAEAEVCIFASSCENLPNILIEGMAAALPIACSNCGPMPEVLGTAGLYFDPENPISIADAVRRYILDAELRAEKAAAAAAVAQNYSWKRCADETMKFLADIARRNKGLRAPA